MNKSLRTDLYQIMMMAAYFYKGMHNRRITCEAFVRKLPPERRFLVMAGTEEITKFLLDFKFIKDDIKFLKEIPAISRIMSVSNFEMFLREFRFTGDLWAMADGEIVFPGEPLVSVSGTLPEVCMAETFILSVLNHNVKIASKAARIILASRGKSVVEFGTRRTHHSAAIDVAKLAYLTGFVGTSNIEASKRFGIPLVGTMSHMWVMVNESEEESFKRFDSTYPNPILLIDTYDTLKGAQIASTIKNLQGVRLDSGDLDNLSRKVRTILDQRGQQKAKIIVSGDLNEYLINTLTSLNAPIDIFAVGTDLAVSRDVPSLNIVYKPVYDDTNQKPLIKLSPGKKTFPGKKRVFIKQYDDELYKHVIYIDGEMEFDGNETFLLDCYILNGQPHIPIVSLDTARKYCNASLHSLDMLDVNLALLNPHDGLTLPVILHKSVKEMFERTMK